MDIQGQPFVSIVTPVFNCEEYLSECIHSVLAQTYRNWEYIIVNNCCTDGSLEIAQYFADSDPRIRIHNNSQFAGIVENHGIAFRQISPTSKYCKMVFADDSLYPECITEMVDLAEKNPSVGIVGAYGVGDAGVLWDGLPVSNTVVPGREICRSRLLGGPYLFGTFTSLLIRSDLIRTLKALDDYANLHADTEACYELLQCSDFGFVHQVLTYTRTANESTASFSRRLNTTTVGSLADLIKYGPVYLSKEELNICIKERMEYYYSFLGKNIFKMRGREFWDYHSNRLEALGLPLSWVRLAVSMMLEFADHFFNPKRTIEGVIRKFL